MSKRQKSPSKPKPADGGSLKCPNLMTTNPNRQQFEPTPAQPIRQRARMGGA